MERLLREGEAASRIAVSCSTLQKWRFYRNPDAPGFIKHGRSVRYLESEINAWIARRAEAARAAQTAGVRS